MSSIHQLRSVLTSWSSILGTDPEVGPEVPERELWPVTAHDRREYFLKRLGPWRNLPLADEYRILVHLAASEIPVARYLITDQAMVFAGAVEESFVLMPRLTERRLVPVDDEAVGAMIGKLHRALASYPWQIASYREDIVDHLQGELMLPDDLLQLLAPRRSAIVAALTDLPEQLIHGDLTTSNVLLDGPIVSGIIDCDHLPYGSRLWDIGKYLSRRIRSADIGCVGQFIAGYQSTNPLTEQEQEAVPAAIVTAALLETDWSQRIQSGVLERRMLPDHEQQLRAGIASLRTLLTDLEVVASIARR